MKIVVENIFMCLVLFWKWYFPTNFLHFLCYFLSIRTNFITENFKITAKSQSTKQITAKYPSLATTNNNPQPSKFIPTTETTPHTTETPIQPTAANSGNQKPQSMASKQNPPPHNKKTTKMPPPTSPQQQQKSKLHRERDQFMGSWWSQRLWVAGEVEGSSSRSKIGGLKALALGQRLWIRGVIWALDVRVKLKTGSWVCSAKSLGCRRWALSLSLSLSLFAPRCDLTLSLSLCFPENDIWR